MRQLEADTHYPIDIDELPSTWTVTYIGDIIKDMRPGFSSGTHNRDGRGVVHLRPMNINRDGRIVLSDVKYVAPDSDLRVKLGDVLFNNTNSAELVGKTAPIVEEADWAFSNHMTRLRLPLGLSHRFVAYQLHFLWSTGYFRYRSTQHVNQASISTRTLSRTVLLIVPPTNEQFRIVAEIEKQFDRLDETQASLENAIAKLETYNRAVLQQAVEGTLLPTEAEIARQERRDYETSEQLLARIYTEVFALDQPEQLGFLEDAPSNNSKQVSSQGKLQINLPNVNELTGLPQGWAWVRVKHAGEITLGRQRAPQHQNGLYQRPYLRVANVFENRIDTSDILQMNFTPEEYEVYRLLPGDILLNEGQSLDLVGRPAMFHNEVPGACFQNTLIRFRANPAVLPEFALIVFRNYFHNKRYQKVAKWSTNIAHLGAGRFAEIEFPLPPLAEQKRIVAEVERTLSIAEKQSATIQTILGRIAHLRYTILKRAFSGKLISQDSNDTPADILVAALRDSVQSEEEKPKKQKEQSNARRKDSMRLRYSLYEVLRNASNEMKPEDLLRESGIGEDLIEEFFLELRREIADGRIEEKRSSNGIDVYLTIKMV